MGIELMYTIPLMGVVGLLVMVAKAMWVNKQDAGDANMKELAGYIARGASAFLKAEWKVLGVFAAIAAGLLAWSAELEAVAAHTDWVIAIAFLIGAFFSAFAGWIGMSIATKANVRTTQAARTSLAKGLQVSFNGGTVMGLGVAGLAVVGLSTLFILFLGMYVGDIPAGTPEWNDAMMQCLEVLAGFSLGAESIALFARVGGGIYTKAADVGADLVGKVEAGIPEDDARNPATIADNVGDNVGDVAGMGADLFGSYVATMLATMVLGREVVSADNFEGMAPILLPMVIAGLGVLFSIIGTFFVRISKDSDSVMAALNKGNWGAMILVAIVSYPLVQWMLPETMQFVRGGASTTITSMNVFWAIMLGLVVGTLMSNLGFEHAIGRLGASFARAKVGDRYVLELLHEYGWTLGGENSGHIICLDCHSTGDGIVSALQVLAALKKQAITLADACKDLVFYPQKLVNVRLPAGFDWRADGSIAAAQARAEQALGESGRVLLRPSGTEPLLRVMVEGRDLTLVEQLARDISDVVQDAVA